MRKCKYGRLKHPLKWRGKKRLCKLKPKSKRGKMLDRGKKSQELHERKYRHYKR